MSSVRAAVEESVIALAAKVIRSTEGDRPTEAAQYASALEDASQSLEAIASAEAGGEEDLG